MPTFLLNPLDPQNPNWQASVYCGPLTIRAKNTDRARRIAQLALGIATRRVPGERVLCNPWDASTGTASCEVIEDANDDPDAEEAILAPAEYDKSWR